MERIRSRIALALGGAGRVWGGGLIVLAAVGLLAGVGCTGPRALRLKDVLPAGWVKSEPATQIVCAFNPQVQHLPDPSKDGVLGAGLSGQLYLIAAGGHFTDANGDLYVMADDITARPPGQSPAVPEIWHFDAATLRKLRTKDERFGDCYALFLPYPPNWKDVTQLRISTQYKPKGDPAKEPTLPGPPQTLLLDFTPAGEQSNVWLKKEDAKPTAPVAMKGMPNVARDMARGGFGAPLTGPQANGTVNAGGPPTGGVMPTGGLTPGPVAPAGLNPFAAPPTGPAPPTTTTPQLPPPMQFTPDRPQATIRGPHGETLNVSAVALPPGQSVPNGWTKQPDGSIQPPTVAAATGQPLRPQQQPQPQQGQMQQTWPAQAGYTATAPAAYQPASASYVPASERQSRIQHGAFNPPQPQQQPPAALPPLPVTAVPPARPALPPVGYVPGSVPALPTTPGGVSGPAMPVNLPPNFDPTSPVGAWAVPPAPPAPPGSVPGYPTVVPPVSGGFDPPNVTQTIKRY